MKLTNSFYLFWAKKQRVVSDIFDYAVVPILKNNVPTLFFGTTGYNKQRCMFILLMAANGYELYL